MQTNKNGWKVGGPELIAEGLMSPAGITLNARGTKIYIAEFGRESKNEEKSRNTKGRLSFVDLTLKFPTEASVVGKDTTNMNTPHAVRVDEKKGVMYSVQVESHKLLIFD